MHVRRTAFIASVGLLVDDVNASIFIEGMLARAGEKNEEFKSPEKQLAVKIAGFGISEKFNCGKLEPAAFKQQILALLGDLEMEDQLFWQEWNSMVKAGNICEKLNEIKFRLGAFNTIHLYSNTNTKHASALATEFAKFQVLFNLEKTPPELERIPVHLSFRKGVNRLELITAIHEQIKSQVFKPNNIVVIMGDPNNILDPLLKNNAAREAEKLKEMGEKMGFQVVLHDKTKPLADTIHNVLLPATEEKLNKRLGV